MESKVIWETWVLRVQEALKVHLVPQGSQVAGVERDLTEPEGFQAPLDERVTEALMGFLDCRGRRGTEEMQGLKDNLGHRERMETGAMMEKSAHEGCPVNQAPGVYLDQRDQRDFLDPPE